MRATKTAVLKAVAAALAGALLLEARAAAATCTQTAGPTRALGLFKPGKPVALDEGFRDPPPISRVQCWWQCHGSAFTKKEITRQLEEFKAKGMGGVTIKDTLPMSRDGKTAHIKDIPYMSPQWLDMFAHIVAECNRLGLICRSRLGSGWNEGGPWVSPEMSSQIVAFARSKPIAGPAEYAGPIPTAKNGSPTATALRSGEAFVLALPDSGRRGVDLTDKVSDGRKLTWDVPKGTWALVSCFSKPSGIRNMSASPSGAGLHHDHLSAAGTDLHLENVAGRMLATLGPFENTAFDGFNSDSWELGNPTWTPGFRRAFIARRGYDPVPYLPILERVKDARFRSPRVDELGAEGSRFLFDLRTTASDLIVENFYGRVSKWSRARGVAFEAQAAGGPGHFLPMDFLHALGAVDIPMGEFWMHGRSYVKIASSGAHAYGKRLVGLEAFTYTPRRASHFAVSPAWMKTRADEAFLLGGNYQTLAVVEYSPAEAGRPGWVHNCCPHLNHCQSWWPLARPFFDYLARCCFLLQSGRNVGHVAVYHTFRDGKSGLWAAPGDDHLAKRSKAFAFDYVNDDLVQNHMSARDGRIVLTSGASYQILYIVPTRRPSMALATLAKIRDLVRQGATVVWAGKPPAHCPGLADSPQCDAELKAIVKELWDGGRLITLPKHDYARLVPILEESPSPPAWRRLDNSPLRFVHRRTSEADIFFVVNRATWDVKARVLFRVKDRAPELWVPETGEMKPAPWEKAAAGARLTVRLPPLGSVFVVLRKGGGAPPRERRAAGKALAPIVIDGPWQVEFPEGSGAPPRAVLRALKSWTETDDPGIRHFSGIAVCRTTFACPKAGGGLVAILDLGRVAEVCEVRLNGKLVGTRWHPPYRLDVTGALRAGENRLEVRVANLWHNRLVGDAGLPKAKRVTRMVPESHYQRLRGKSLIDSGLLGPVRIAVSHAERKKGQE